ncbi:Zinc finger, ZZ type protein [Ceratobasidium theobromae]|uniref:Zinc finger, ZZ type protein n=1 Tax=Ceratobasidium theobromae TaxID=1582974 RepID=A0A5N5QIZ9_9AGAM|nr:Zinc finger, ZZ type protein [Ceratobasidium theobromae]
MGLFDFISFKDKPSDLPTHRPPPESTSSNPPAHADAPPAYHSLEGNGIRSSAAHDAATAYNHLRQDDNEDPAIWSCRGCGITNAPVRYKCKYHTKHAPHNFALVTAHEGIWRCDGCGTHDAPLRAKCRSCPDADLCLECFTGRGVANVHPAHPREEDFSWSLYSDATWECEGCGLRNGDLSFKCRSCRDLTLCPKCIGSAEQHHKLHPNKNDYMPVISLNRWWKCESCGHKQEELIRKERASVRWDCKFCENDSLCSKCFESVEKKHKKHPRQEDFAPVLYLFM